MDGEIVASSETSKDDIRILVVDDDTTCLNLIARKLKTCQYEVFTTMKAFEGLKILRESESTFNLVLTDVHMPEMDGFEFLDKIQEEFDVPVVMMSGDNRQNVMLRALECGAAFYFVKPLTMSDIRNIWQFAFVTKNENTRASEKTGSIQGRSTPRKGSEEDMEALSSVNQGNSKQQGSKKKVTKNSDEEEADKDDSANERKERLIWSKELHQLFVDAVNTLGIDKAVPKKIVELMNVPELKRENVASHLQKYRIFLKREQTSSRSPEPTLGKTLTIGTLTAGQYPWSSLNPQQGLPQFRYQPGFNGGSRHNLNAPTPMPSSGPPRFYNREAQASTVMSQLIYGQPLQSSSQVNLQQPSFGTAAASSSSNPRTGVNYFGFGKEPQEVQTSSFSGDASRGVLMKSRDTIRIRDEQRQGRSANFARGPVHNNFNNTPRVENRGYSCNSFNEFPKINYSTTNSNYAGIQMTSNGELVGFGQTGPIRGQPSKDIDYSNNLLDEIFKGKKTANTAAASSSYASQGASSSQGFANADYFFPTNFVQPPPPPPPPPPAPPSPPPLQQEWGDNYSMGDGSLLDLIKSCSTFENTSIPQQFDDAYLGNLIFNQGQGGSEEFGDLDFNIN